MMLSIIIPVFNEAEAILPFLSEISKTVKSLPIQYELIFVNDGSTDSTLQTLLQEQEKDHSIRIIDLSRNFGKEAALTAGLTAAKGDAIVPIDVDLQDPPEIIIEMLGKWKEGYEVVLGRRINRNSDSWAKRSTANWFYRLHNRIAQPRLPEDVGDFRLMDRKVVIALNRLFESHRFMKGLFAWVGFRTTIVDYVRAPRFNGTSKFNGWKLWNFAIEGITSFSTSPLRIWTYVGLIVSFAAFAFGAFISLRTAIYGVDVPGYASIVVAVTFIGGLQLTGIGVLGEYLGRAYIETKRRPIFIVREIFEMEIGTSQNDNSLLPPQASRTVRSQPGN
ncbi:glycosyltransferase family 2 protein [Variovorax robiniae]|uniref:Glycosyltransferase family 2 protein n=1 Tax=Variovorax robiniae TaxID=1836199 RepID=A0ABU8X4W9_9BURK